mmetsp:Transcript_2292/g.4751  ORF Transcript_2292/g.4751 Transcript_2292/m.4751 type:complete len:86 (-) Transcript_2292:244-501(-)
MGFFAVLFSVLDVQSDSNPSSMVNDPSIVTSVSPELNELPLGSDRNTWPNIVRNKRNILFCEKEFDYLGNRLRCVRDFAHGPLLD